MRAARLETLEVVDRNLARPPDAKNRFEGFWRVAERTTQPALRVRLPRAQEHVCVACSFRNLKGRYHRRDHEIAGAIKSRNRRATAEPFATVPIIALASRPFQSRKSTQTGSEADGLRVDCHQSQ